MAARGHRDARAESADLSRFAADVAAFLVVLRGLDAAGGPEPGPHNFARGGPVATYAQETADALAALGPEVDGDACRRVWDLATASSWQADPVWLHGDVGAGNLLVRDGRLSAVIDFGGLAVGDPACDLVAAWTLFDDAARAVWRRANGLDDATWARARGWALWKALVTLLERLEAGDREGGVNPRRVIAAVLADQQAD